MYSYAHSHLSNNSTGRTAAPEAPVSLQDLVRIAREAYITGDDPNDEQFITTVDQAIAAAITLSANELVANDCQHFLNILPKDVCKPSDLWFVDNPIPYMIQVARPVMLKMMMRSPKFKAKYEADTQATGRGRRRSRRAPA